LGTRLKPPLVQCPDLHTALAGSDWALVMRNGMKAKGTAACLYFIAWQVVGNFVLLTLFLAILITNFTMDEVLLPPSVHYSLYCLLHAILCCVPCAWTSRALVLVSVVNLL
jgi:hypothetical protein